MVSKIKLLPESTINQIAAGEVIENPASVIKELVENAIDAKANKIEIEIQGGGLQLIRVHDNGEGMNRKELLLSLERHATSKIGCFEDLSFLRTMGFRGEALASIASIAKMSIESSDGYEANRIEVIGGKVLNQNLCARNRGTTIEVRSLFFNVPARKEFQKSDRTMTTEVAKIVNRLALAHPKVSFSFSSSQKRLLHTSSFEDLEDKVAIEKRIEDVLGRPIFSHMIPIYLQDGPFIMRGFIGKPHFVRKNRLSQYLFVNGRYVHCQLIEKAIREGYGTRINFHDFPVFVLYIDMPSKWVDVNVHPQKKQVRLREEAWILGTIQKGVSSALYPVQINKTPVFSFTKETKTFSLPEISELPQQIQKDVFEQPSFAPLPSVSFQPIELLGPYFLIRDLTCKDREKISGLVLVDLERALSRCLLESFEEAFQKQGQIRQSQKMLSPLILDLSNEEIYLAETWEKSFSNMGLNVRILGEKTLCIDSIPHFIDIESAKDLFETMLEEFSLFDQSTSIDQIFLKKMALQFSRIAKKRKETFSEEQARAIIKEILLCKDPLHDALGYPIWIALDKEHIEILFKKKGG